MSDTVVSVKDLHKEFVISNTAIGSIKTLLVWWKRRSVKRFQVLKGVSFDIKRGECVALVGRNGAGKSTLLSLIAKVYKPTSGTIKVNGRLAPLLELGAGFHPDLSGAENVFFNAMILGLTRKQARERFQEILDFSELGDHVFAPVRSYSSGMIARLGFSVAVHVDAEILIVDEVLAVGDFEFGLKCLQRLKEFREKGGTILLVSHQAETVMTFADRAIWIQHGEVQMDGTPAEVMPVYKLKSESDLGRAQ
ncbi:MAG TPA: ABC transporter ATP-binding protein [Fimbriimonas sp.]|nr:ABC transporter ATP-binding protein [Fimbriimonas sp.]